ncbi:hypothetical protein PGTUg99_003672 [Puccinia graminis f. sp. tritici]|uniref:Uncharacterized protein n=1 Tax=Puccinia graminis f. sp. tritici TaxID=56615 RepID=A0A5B0S4N8_PUCGR|nr:hypothetical protein PGTUg99_003672 [Puccinia graminis f. sp. tritici]
MYIDLDRKDTPEPRAGAPHVAGRNISEPVVVERAHEALMAAGPLPVANPNVQTSESPTNTTGATSNLSGNLPGSLAPPNGHSTSNHEENHPRRMPPAPTLAEQLNANPFVARVPFPPEQPAMEAIGMETYLNIAHIPRDNLRTRSRLLVHGIGHWTFFRATNKAELQRLGFPLGIARLLCEGVALLEAFVEEMEQEGIEISPILYFYT